MKKDEDKDIPLIINGELNIGRKTKVKKVKDVSLPTKRFGFVDILLSLIGLVFVIYGVYTSINSTGKKDNKLPEEPTNNIDKTLEEKMNIDYEALITLSASEINIYNSVDTTNMNSGLLANNLSNNAKLSLAAKISNIESPEGKKCILESELDANIKYLFGDISYTKEAFKYGDLTYTYNQETKRYYLLTAEAKTLNYDKYDYIVKEEDNDVLIIKDYVAYTFFTQNRTISINKETVSEMITKDNINEKYNLLEHYEYRFKKIDNKYVLESITIER